MSNVCGLIEQISQQSRDFSADSAIMKSGPLRRLHRQNEPDQIDQGAVKMAEQDNTRQGRNPTTGTNEEYGPFTWVHIGDAARQALEKASHLKAVREAAYSRKVLDKKGFAP